MAVEDELRLAELLCARLCHDLSGPISGASAGAELLADEATPDADTVVLVADSVAVATRLLRVLRAALGVGTQPFAAAELEALARSIFPESGTVRLAWSVQSGDAGCDRVSGKILLNLLMIARDILPRGGTAAVRWTTAPWAMEIALDGPKIVVDELRAALAASSPQQLGARGVQAFYAARLAEALGRSIVLAQSAGRLVMTVE